MLLTIIPDLVPRTIKIGKAQNAEERKFHFSVIELIEGEVLEDVWHLMNAEDQIVVMTELVEALEKLHSVRFDNKSINHALEETLRGEGDETLNTFAQPGVFGGPHTGFLNNGHDLLDSIMGRRKLQKPTCTSETLLDPQGVKI